MKNSRIFVLVALAALAAAACEKEKEYGTTLLPAAEEDLTGVKVYVNETAGRNAHLTRYETTPVSMTIPEDTVSLYPRLNRAATGDVVVSAMVEGLPEGTYKFVREQVTIKAGACVADEDIRVVLVENDALYDLEGTVNAKIRLQLVSGPAEMGKNLNSIDWNVLNSLTLIYLGDDEGLGLYEAADVEYKGYAYPERFRDGDYGQYCALNTSTDYYVDLGSIVALDGIGFVPYAPSAYYLRYWIGEAEFFTSNDADNWTSIGVLGFNEGVAGTWQVARFYAPISARYFKVHFNRNYTSSYSSIYISEWGVFGDLSLRELYTVPASASVRVGKTIRLEAFKRPINAPQEMTFTWSSADPSVATVDQEGHVTGVAPGAALITVSGGGFEAGASVIVTENVDPEFFGNYTMKARTSATGSLTERHFEIRKADDTHVTVRCTDESQRRTINGKDAWLIGTLPYEKVDGDHYRITWTAGTVFATDFLTGSGLSVPKVYACLYRGTGTSASFRAIDTASVDLEFSYDEISGKFKGSFGATHDWSYEASGIGLAYDYVNASGREYTNQSWMVMWGGNDFSFTKD